MYIGQMGTTPWLKTSWLSKIGCQQSSPAISAVRSQEQTRTNVANRDRVELSGAYSYLPNRLQVLETPEATPVNAKLDLAADLRPASEKAYTEEDALMNQYMKQYRMDFVKIGDSFELDPSKPVKLMTEGQVSQASLDAFRAQLEENGLGDEIDWRGVQEDFARMDIRFDNAESFETKADYLASRYAILKDRIQTQYTGEEQEQEMQTLDDLYTKAKEEMADSYAANIGGFYEELGQAGTSEDMRESVLTAIDGKADEYSAYLAENDIYADITDPSKQWLKQDDGYMAARLRESASGSAVDAPTAQAASNPAPYSADDLSFAAVYAKGLSQQIKKPEWDTYEIKDSDADLGKYLAQQYQSLTGAMEDAGVSDRLSALLKDSFKPFLNKFLDALDANIDHNRERVAQKPWQAGLIRTEYINRKEVYRAFSMTTGQAVQDNNLELSQDQSKVTLDVPDEISIEIPRAWTIMSETMEGFNEHLQWSLEEADRQNLSFGDRLTFLKEEGQKWVEDKRQNDPEMFVAWLKINQESIERGEAGLVGLPSDFTMEDYDSYVSGLF